MTKENLGIALGGIALIIAIFAVFLGGGEPSPRDLGGTTADNWNVGGNLAVTGTSAFTGAISLSGALTVTGATTLTGATDAGLFTQGGGRTASSTTNATETLLVTDIDTENFLDYTPNLNTTLTLPASSTMSALIPNIGDTRQIIIRNASSTGAATLTLAAGTGIDLQEIEGLNLVLNGLDYGILTLIRKAADDGSTVIGDIAALWAGFQED